MNKTLYFLLHVQVTDKSRKIEESEVQPSVLILITLQWF